MDSKLEELLQEVEELRVLIEFYRRKNKDLMREKISDQGTSYKKKEEKIPPKKYYSNILPREIFNILRERDEAMTREEIIRGLEDRNVKIQNNKRSMSHTVAISLGRNPLFKLISDNDSPELKKFGLVEWPDKNEKSEEE